MVPPKKRGWRASESFLESSLPNSPSSVVGCLLSNDSTESPPPPSPAICPPMSASILTSTVGKSDLAEPKVIKTENIEIAPIVDVISRIEKESESRQKHPRKSFLCSQCDQEFPTNKKMLIHISSTHAKTTFGYLCDSCPERFCDHDSLNLHFSAVHENQPKRAATSYKHPCHVCKTGFMKRGMLILHMTKCHPDVDINTCKSLKIEIFEEEKNWLCPYCERKYLSSGKRREHIRKCHPNSDLPPTLLKANKGDAMVSVVRKTQKVPHKCPYCPMEYAHRTKLLKHCKEKHKDKPVPYKYQKWKARDRMQRGLVEETETKLPLTKNIFTTKESGQGSITLEELPYLDKPSQQNWIDLPFPDEDTRHSVGSFMSDITPTTPHQPISSSTFGTSNSEVSCKSEIIPDIHHSQSLPAAIEFLQWNKSNISDQAFTEFRVVDDSQSVPTHSSSLISVDCHSGDFLVNPQRARNATFSGISLISDSLIEEDSAQSAPPGFHFGPNFDPLEDVENDSSPPVLHQASRNRDDLLSQAFNSAINSSSMDDSLSSDKKFSNTFPHLSYSDQSENHGSIIYPHQAITLTEEIEENDSLLPQTVIGQVIQQPNGQLILVSNRDSVFTQSPVQTSPKTRSRRRPQARKTKTHRISPRTKRILPKPNPTQTSSQTILIGHDGHPLPCITFSQNGQQVVQAPSQIQYSILNNGEVV